MATPPFKDDTLLARWLSGELSVKEEKEVAARPDLSDFQRMLGNLSRMAPPEFDAADGFRKLKSERAERRATGARKPSLHPRSRPLARILPWSAAAAVMLLLTLWFLLRDEANRFTAVNGNQQAIAELTDGSTVRLNAGSDLTFAATAETRDAELSGEAYFEVEKSTVPFVVKTSLGEVRVVGTSFNVYDRNGEMAVSCTTGKVDVRFTGNPEIYPLTPGKSVVLDREGEVAVAENTGPEQLDWLAGRSVFIKRPLFEILDELERQFDLTVTRPAALDQNSTYTVTFPNDNLANALEYSLTPIAGFRYELKRNTVTIIPTE